MRFAVLPSLLTCAAALAAASAASAAPRAGAAKPTPACGIVAVPLVVGNSWTYAGAVPPDTDAYRDRILSPAVEKSTPLQPSKVTITVDKIETDAGTTTITLTEDHDGRKHVSTATCTATKLVFSPNAFWFNAEPGDTYAITLADVERKGASLQIAAGKLVDLPEWADDLKATWKHEVGPKHKVPVRSGTIELKRRVVMQPVEEVDAGAAGKWKAKKIGIDTTIAITIDPAPEKPLIARPRVVNFLFQVDGVGIVQAVNSYGRMYTLSGYTVQ